MSVFSFLVLTFLGSSFGGLCRYLLSGIITRRFGERFPAGILAVNITGAFLIGLVWSLPWDNGSFLTRGAARDFLMFGFLGGYTTVSSFTWDTLNLLRDDKWLYAGFNLFGSWLLCLGAVYAGALAGGA